MERWYRTAIVGVSMVRSEWERVDSTSIPSRVKTRLAGQRRTVAKLYSRSSRVSESRLYGK